MSEDKESVDLAVLEPKPSKSEAPKSVIDAEKKEFMLGRLANQTRNVLLGWTIKGFGAWALGDSVASLVTLIRVAEYYGADRNQTREALLDGWNDSIDKFGKHKLKLERWELDRSTMPESLREEYFELKTIRQRARQAKIDLHRKIKSFDPKRHYPAIRAIVSSALQTWEQEGIDFDNFTEPILKIADLDIPRAYFAPQKGGTIAGLTLVDPVRNTYREVVGEAKIEVEQVPVNQGS